MALSLEERLWRRVERTAGCWLWTGHRGPTGYASLRRGGAGTPKVYVHRAAYEMLKGPIPDGCEIDHLCRVRHCVNPDHLEAVPHRINNLRGNSPSAVHARKTHCPQGHPYDEINTYVYRGMRQCRICMDVRRAAWKQACRAKGA